MSCVTEAVGKVSSCSQGALSQRHTGGIGGESMYAVKKIRDLLSKISAAPAEHDFDLLQGGD